MPFFHSCLGWFFGRVMGENAILELTTNQVWNLSTMSQPMLVFLKQESTFHPLSTAAILFLCWKCVGQKGLLLPHTAYCTMTTTILKSSIPSHGIDVSKNHFFNGGIDARARICKPFKEPRNRLSAWRAGTTT